MHLLSEHLNRALQQTLKALKLPPGNQLGMAETSTFLKYLLLDILTQGSEQWPPYNAMDFQAGTFGADGEVGAA